VKFKVDVEPIRDRLERIPVQHEGSPQLQRRSMRTRKQSPLQKERNKSIPRDSSNRGKSSKYLQDSQLWSESNHSSNEEEVRNQWCYKAEYRFEVVFINGLMKYTLYITNTDRWLAGEVSLASVCEPQAS